MQPSFLAEHFESALAYGPYVATGNPDQQRRWQQVHDAVTLTPPQVALLAGFVRQMKVLVISGVWCGDCIQQCPILEKFALVNPDQIELRFVDRDQRADLSAKVRMNGGDRVPVALFLSEDHELCGV